MFHGETIAAVATAMQHSGIGIIRMSGAEAIQIANEIFVSVKEGKRLIDVKSHTVHYGTIVDGEKILDEVLVMVMKAPNTYTREDVVEINCHGGILIVNKILELVLHRGARLAEPGEFTKRAFLNGRIDLSQAEAVTDMINAKNSMALEASVVQLKGGMRDVIVKERAKIIHHIAYIEAALDDPEHIEMEHYGDELIVVVEEILEDLEQLLSTADNAKLISEGIKTVILGKPNAGKSSLLNRLLKEERAIVTEIAGTTRDTLEETMTLSDVHLNIVDTAGIRDTDDVVEKIGVDRAKKVAEDADLIIYVIDASVELDENDKEIIQLIENKKSIVLLNKSDLQCIVSVEEIETLTGVEPIVISAKENHGIQDLENKIKELFYQGMIAYNDQLYVTNVRHKRLLEEAVDSLNLVKRSIEDDLPEDFYSIDLMNAYELLGEIIGEAVSEDLVNEIFSKFCMGK